MRPLARWGTLPLLAAPIGTWALGLGDIELYSALNQPLDAEIDLVSATPEELAGLSVALAPLATFERYGLDRPAFLNSLEFDVGQNAAGEPVIRVSSTQSMAEPFVTMLVEAEWPRGRLLREYTVFLDPPLFVPEPAAPQPVEPAQTRAPNESGAGGPIERPAESAVEPAPEPSRTAAPTPSPAPQPVPRQAETPTPAPTPARAPALNREGTTYGPVQNAETLWGIATRFRPEGVSINQMLVAVYEANPQAFSGNMNILRRGAILRIPPLEDLTRISTADATAEFVRQVDEWQGRRASAGTAAGSAQARLVLVPPDESAAAGPAAGADSGAAAELSALRDEVTDLQGQLDESRRLLEVRNSELADLQNQLSAADEAPPVQTDAGPVPAVDPGVDLESEQLFVDEAPGDEAPADALTDEPAADVPDAIAVAPPRQAAAPPAVTTPPAEQSLVSRIIGMLTSPMVMIGGGVLVVLLGALMFLRRRGEDAEDVTGQWEALQAELDEDDEDIAATSRLREQADTDIIVEDAAPGIEATGEMPAAPAAAEPPARPSQVGAVSESEELADATLSSQTVINLDQADPIAEADFHMAYGLYDQAADLVSKALESDPGNREYKLKLLEVFFVWGNKELFLDAAKSLRAEMGEGADPDWDKVIIMGKQICPDEALFAGAQAAAGSVDLDLEAGDSPGLDLAFGEGDDQDIDLDFGGVPDNDIALEDTGRRAGGDLEDTGRREGFDLEDTGRRESVGFDDTLGFDTSDTVQRKGIIGENSAESADDDVLDIGERTSAGLEAALFEMDDDVADETSPNIDVDSLDVDSLAATQESPTVETARGSIDDEAEDDWSAVTMESPTIEQAGMTAETLESSAPPELEGLEEGEMPTVETPTIETAKPDSQAQSPEMTAELDLDDLGLEMGDIDDLPSDLGALPAAADAESDTREQPAIEADDDLLSATGVTQVLNADDGESSDEDDSLEHAKTAVLSDDDATMMAPAFDADKSGDTEVLSQPGEEFDEGDDESLDLNLDDLTQALHGGDTIEQPHAGAFDASLFEDDKSQTPVDLDVGAHIRGDDEPTGTEEFGPLDAQTMTEVGTKLDLARAYIDMGDPEGAKSILEEVLTEGDSAQRREAQTLIDALPA